MFEAHGGRKGVKDNRGSKLGGSGNCIYNIHLQQSLILRYGLTHVTASEMVLYLTLNSVFGVELCRDVVPVSS